MQIQNTYPSPCQDVNAVNKAPRRSRQRISCLVRIGHAQVRVVDSKDQLMTIVRTALLSMRIMRMALAKGDAA